MSFEQTAAPANDLDTGTVIRDEGSRSPVLCLRCAKAFDPRRPGQLYCGNVCRRRTLKLRKEVARHGQCLESRPGLSVKMLRGYIDGARQRIGLRPTARDPQLGVIAQLAQARAQIERWTAAAARWEARAQKLAQVPRHQVLILRPGPLNLQLTDRADLVAIAADDPGLAVLVLGFRD